MSALSTPFRRLAALAALLLAAAGAQAATCYVAPVAADHASNIAPFGDAANTGADWSHPLTLQAALGKPACTDIRLRQGVYKPGRFQSDADRVLRFTINRTLQLRGGYTGSSDTRDADPRKTVLSGDIDGTSTSADGIDDTDTDHNSHQIVYIDGPAAGGIDADTVLDGFTITAALNDADPYLGGGLYCDGHGSRCSPTLSHLVFSGNATAFGGGGAVFTDGTGGGDSSPAFSHVVFTGNGGLLGGAVRIDGSDGNSSPSFTDVTFSGNLAKSGGAVGVAVDSAQGISSPRFVNVTFSGNTAQYGGAVAVFNGQSAQAISSPVFINVTFSGNRATMMGGAVYHEGAYGTGASSFSNVTFDGNTGVALYASSSNRDNPPQFVIRNSVLWGNRGGETTEDGSATIVLPGSLVDVNPLLGALADNGGSTLTHLPQVGSPVIDAALDCKDATGNPIATDQRGLARPQGTQCDIGAVEVPSHALTVTVTGAGGSVSAGTLPAPLGGGIAGCTSADSTHCAASYDVGAAVTLTAAAQPGWHLLAWGGACGGAASTCDLTLNQDRSATAQFVLNSYAITTAVAPTGAGTLACDPTSVQHGSTTTCTPVPDAASGYELDGVTSTCGGTLGDDGRFTAGPVTADCTVTATFKLKTYAIATAVTPAGAGTLACDSASVQHGGTATCTPTPNAASGYELDGVTSTCGGALGDGHFTTGAVTAACTVTAIFRLKTYAIHTAVTPADAGTLTCDPASVQHGSGTTCTATAADAGFTLAGFDGCVRVDDSNQCTLSDVQADTTVTTRFAPVTTFNGTTVPASGSGEPASASFTGGGESCRFDTETAFIAPPAAPPEGQTLPQGMFHFKLIGCEPGSTVAMSVTWPRPVAGYVKYGPAASGAQPSYFVPNGLSINGRTVIFTVQDGALGDDDGQANGEITDPSGPTARVAFIPTLGEWGLLLLSLLAGLLGMLAARRKV